MKIDLNKKTSFLNYTTLIWLVNDEPARLFRISAWTLTLVVWIWNSLQGQTADLAEIWSTSLWRSEVKWSSEFHGRHFRFGWRDQIGYEWPSRLTRSYMDLARSPWCYGYRRRKWTRRHEFKSWTSLIAFYKALIPLGKVSIQLFSLQLWINSRKDWVLQPWWGN